MTNEEYQRQAAERRHREYVATQQAIQKSNDDYARSSRQQQERRVQAQRERNSREAGFYNGVPPILSGYDAKAYREGQAEGKTHRDLMTRLNPIRPTLLRAIASPAPSPVQHTASTSYPESLSYGYPNIHAKSRWPKPFHAWWWLETKPLAACEELGDRMVEAAWSLKFSSSVLTAFVIWTCVRAWPWAKTQLEALSPDYGLWISPFAGAAIGLILPRVAGRLILLVTKALGFAIAATLRLTIIAAVSAAVYLAVSLINAR